MTPTQRGAYCSKCQKEVIDFTNKSKFDLGQLVNRNGKLCGKFKPEQIDTPINFNANFSSSRLGLFLSITSLIAFTTPALSQIKLPKTIQLQKEISEETNSSSKATDSVSIRGQVLGEDDDLPVPGAHIMLKGTIHGTQTDFDGYFDLEVNKDDIKKSAIIIVSFIGFEVQEIKINPNTDFLKVILKEDDALMGEVIIIKKQNIFRRIGNLFKGKNKNTCH